jgi:hypothetical protein
VLLSTNWNNEAVQEGGCRFWIAAMVPMCPIAQPTGQHMTPKTLFKKFCADPSAAPMLRQAMKIGINGWLPSKISFCRISITSMMNTVMSATPPTIAITIPLIM